MAGDRRSKKANGARREPDGSAALAGRRKLSPPAIGWEAYRGWLGRLDRPVNKRQGPDSVYTWKGYQAWTAKVRSDWEPEG